MTEYPLVALGQVASVRSGYAFKSSDWLAEGIPVVKIANVKGGRLAMGGCSFVDETMAEQAAEFRLVAGDILIAMTGYIGEVARVAERDLPALLNQRVGKFSVRDHRRLNADYLYQLLSWQAIRSEIEGLGYGSAQPNVSPALIGTVKVPLPPLQVQRDIAAILGALDDKIDLNRRMNETLEAMARAIFQDWFVTFGPTRAKQEGRPPYLAPDLWSLFPAHLDPDGKPEGWRAGSLLDLCQLKRGYDLPASQRVPGPVPIVSSSGITDHHERAMVDGPGVVTGRYGTIGEVFFIEEPFWPLNTALYIKDFRGNSRRFVFYTLRLLDFGQYSDKGAVPGVNRNDLHRAPATLPPPKVQQVFETILAPAWERIAANESESRTLAATRDLLLPKLMSGKIRVNDAEAAMEAAL